MVGLAPVAASVTVNSSAVDYRRGEYYQELLSPVNTSVSVWQSVAVATSGGGSTSGNVYVPKTPENFSYDTDGNQTVDGRWNYTWDAENRLIRMVANTAVGPQQRIDYGYDAKGRRISKKVWSNTAGTGSPATYNRFIYDGWNLLAELDGNNTNAIVRSYIWGSDLSGSMQGAVGMGGLLMINDPTTVATHFVAHDGNGNVAATVSGSAGTTTATYEYGPFGEVIRSSGTISKTNPYRFSTKYQDNETDLLYYGYRYYSQSTGRWLSRDPIEEKGGKNLYGFVRNCPISWLDALGKEGVGSLEGSPFFKDGPISCGELIRDEVWKNFGANRPTTDPSARKAHCIAYCRISRECPGGDITSWIGGFAKEIQDLIKQSLGNGGEGYNQGDMNANAIGRGCAKKKKKTCESLCTEAFNNGSLTPPVPPPPGLIDLGPP